MKAQCQGNQSYIVPDAIKGCGCLFLFFEIHVYVLSLEAWLGKTGSLCTMGTHMLVRFTICQRVHYR